MKTLVCLFGVYFSYYLFAIHISAYCDKEKIPNDDDCIE